MAIHIHKYRLVINEIENKFGKTTTVRCNKRTCVSMDIEFTDDGTVKLFMKYYIIESIDDFGDDINNETSIPVKGELFEIDRDATFQNLMRINQ